MEEFISKNKLIKDLIDKGFYPAIVKSAIENAPTEDVVPRSEVEEIVKFKDMAYAELKSYLVEAKQEVAREIVQILKDYVKSDDCLTWDLSDKEQNELCKIHNLGVNAVKQSIDIIAMEISHKYIGE